MKLSPHVTLAEMTASATAVARGIDNSAPAWAIPKLIRVAVEIIEPIRAHFGRPVHINSGWRCLLLNSAVGSSRTSQHAKAEAADLEVPDIPNGDVAVWCRDHLKFGQLILEAYTPGQPSSGWVHLSLPTRGPKNQQVMTATPGSHGMVYSVGLHV